MVLKSYAKINLSLKVVKKLSNGFHDIQSVFCLVNIFDRIYIKKIKSGNCDKIYFKGPYSKHVNNSENTVQKILNILRKINLISSFYNVKIDKKIPVFAGLGGGTSNAASILKYLISKKLSKKKLNKIVKIIGSDMKLFFHNQGYLKNLKNVESFKKKYRLHFLIAYPNIKCSTKKIYSKVAKFSKKKKMFQSTFKTKYKLLDFLGKSSNDLQSIVEKNHPIIKKLLLNIDSQYGCFFSRISGSGSISYGLFKDENCAKVALKKLRKKYPKFWFSIAKTI